jgi:SAM-dependent methyltransferase
VDVLSLGEPIRSANGQVTSFVFTPPQPQYDCIVLSEEVELFEHAWSYAFLDRLNAPAAANGAIVLPRCGVSASEIPDVKMNELFGCTPHDSSHSHLIFKKAPQGLNRPRNAAHSTLDAYWELMETLIYGKHDRRLAQTIAALGVQRIGKRTANRETDLFQLLQSQAYRTCSARTKTAITEYIASIYFPGRNDLRLADLGAGTGLNSLELLLNPGPISAVTLVEPRRNYHWDIAAVYDSVRPYLRGPLSLVDRPVEDYAGPGVEVGLVCAVLAMLPAELREPFLSSAWRNLAPGGILLVLENMRAADEVRGGKYNEQRCTPDEIDSLLGRFAPIRYFASNSRRELTFRQVGNQTVFRVIRKPD